MSYSEYDSKSIDSLRRAVKAMGCRGYDTQARAQLIRILTGVDPCLPILPSIVELAMSTAQEAKRLEAKRKQPTVKRPEAKRKEAKRKPQVKRAICITLGEQSENHHGMKKYGKGLADRGFSIEEMKEMGRKFAAMGGKVEWLNCKEYLNKKDREGVEEAKVLILRKGVNVLLKDEEGSKKVFEELIGFEWDKEYYDVRRGRWMDKHARYNVCFGEERRAKNRAERSGTVVGYDEVKLMSKWKKRMEKLCGEKHLEAEGNYYYDVNKTGIRFHGDGERKKVVAANISDEGVIREIHWHWYKDGKEVGRRMKVELKNGDCYVMSDKASGHDWRKTVKVVDGKKMRRLTLRHAAGVKGSKFLRSGEDVEKKRTEEKQMWEEKRRRKDDKLPTFMSNRAVTNMVMRIKHATPLRGILKRLGYTNANISKEDARAMLLGKKYPLVRNKPTSTYINLDSSTFTQLVTEVEKEKMAKAKSADQKKKKKMSAAQRVAENLKKKERLMKKNMKR